MKKNLLLFIFLLLIKLCTAQSWCPVGATWNYNLPGIGVNDQPYDGVIQDKYVGDTVVNGITCKHIVGTFKGKLNFFIPATIVNNYRQSISYENNKVIYVFSAYGNKFDTVVNFNAAIGDKWLKNRYYGQCNSWRAITVIDTGRVTINNISLKKIVTTYTNVVYTYNGTYTGTAIDTIIEKVMSRVNFMFPIHCELDSIYDGIARHGAFICYQDNNFPLYRKAGFSSCDYKVGLNELYNNLLQIKFYPNPTRDNLVLESELLDQSELYFINVFNALGQVVAQEHIKPLNNRFSVDLTPLEPGMYYLQLRNKSGLLAAEKIIKN